MKKVMRESSQDSLGSNSFLRQLSHDTSTPRLLVHPPNWEYMGELWYDLYDVITQEWETSHGELVRKRFSVESWKDDFIALGFYGIVLSGMESVFRVLYEKFGVEIVDLILSYESVGDIAGLVLWGEVDYFSTQTTRKEEKQGDGGGTAQPRLESEMQSSSHTPSTIIPPWDGIRKTSDEEDEDPTKNTRPTQQPSDPTKINYPEWLHHLHQLSAEKGVKLVFSNNDVMDVQTAFAPYTQWTGNVSGAVTSLYHGSDIPNDELADTVASFLNYGVEVSRARRRGYYSATSATYFTNSAPYSQVWPVIKTYLGRWREMEGLPSANILIVVSEPVIEDIIGANEKFITAVIPQHDKELAREVPPPSCSLLICEQYVNATKNPKIKSRVSHPRVPSISTSDFVIAPLPAHTISAMQPAPIGQALNRITPIQSISVLTCATPTSVAYMNDHITTIVVLGWGDGTLGATDKVEYGTAGIKAGTTRYHVDEIPFPESAVQIRDGVGREEID